MTVNRQKNERGTTRRTYALGAAICCLTLGATLAFGWQRFEEDNAPFSVQHGTSLTWGSDGRVWGWFPVDGAHSTYIAIFDPNASEDSMWDDTTAGSVGPRVDGAGCTFQWIEQPGFWGCGWYEYPPGDTVSSLYYYYPNEQPPFGTVNITAFGLGEGATIAYDPNRAYWAANYAVPGWIYCLTDDPADGRSFWRYAIPGGWYVPDLPVYGFYPDSGAIISDLTPHLAWGNTGASQYRVQVSTSSSFTSNVVDSVVTSPDFHATAELNNGTYFWRSASWSGGQWAWCSAVHSFDLEGGWQPLLDIPCDVDDGAVIAYDSGSIDDNYRSILALPGGSTNVFYRYKIGANTWTQLASATDEEEEDGTCLTTRTPSYEGLPLVMARFSTQGRYDVPSQYSGLNDDWTDWVVQGDDLHRSDFPRPMVYSSMVLGGGLMYMLPGGTDNEKDFYQVIAPGAGEGGEGGASRAREGNAHAIAGSDGIEVEYQLPAAARVRATLHDAVGRQVSSLDAGEMQRGVHRLRWDRDDKGRGLSAGAYFVFLDLGAEQARLKAVVK
jgi:hypothetical protein